MGAIFAGVRACVRGHGHGHGQARACDGCDYAPMLPKPLKPLDFLDLCLPIHPPSIGSLGACRLTALHRAACGRLCEPRSGLRECTSSAAPGGGDRRDRGGGRMNPSGRKLSRKAVSADFCGFGMVEGFSPVVIVRARMRACALANYPHNPSTLPFPFNRERKTQRSRWLNDPEGCSNDASSTLPNGRGAPFHSRFLPTSSASIAVGCAGGPGRGCDRPLCSMPIGTGPIKKGEDGASYRDLAFWMRSVGHRGFKSNGIHLADVVFAADAPDLADNFQIASARERLAK